MFLANTHTTLLTFTDRGKAYWTKVHELPLGSRTSKGKAVNNVIQLSPGESVQAIVPVEEFKADKFVVMITEKGEIKRTSLDAFSRPRTAGILSMKTDLDDKVIEASLSSGSDHIFIVTKDGMSIRFSEDEARARGRVAGGVRAVSLADGDKVVGVQVVAKDSRETVLIVTDKGFGKRTVMDEYRIQGRGGMGVITQKTTERVGSVVTAKIVTDKDQVLLTTNTGQSIRISCGDIRPRGRNTEGVRLMNLRDGEHVTSAALLGETIDGGDTAIIEDPGE